MEPKILNLTNHPVNILDSHGTKIVTIPPSGMLPRCIQKTVIDEYLEYNGVKIPKTRTTYGEPRELPDPIPGTYLIVSKIIAEALKGKRDDLLIANGLVRDPLGGKKGCKSLGTI